MLIKTLANSIILIKNYLILYPISGMDNIEFTHISEIPINQHCFCGNFLYRVLMQNNEMTIVYCWVLPRKNDGNLVFIGQDSLFPDTKVMGPFHDHDEFWKWYQSQKN